MAVATLVSAIADLAADARERRALLAKQASSSRSPPSPTQRPELVDHSTVTWAMLLVLAVGAGFIIGRATMLADAGEASHPGQGYRVWALVCVIGRA